MKLKYYLVSLVLLAGTSNDGFWIVPESIVWCLFESQLPKTQLNTQRDLPISNRPGKPYHHDRCYTDNAVPVHVGAEQGQLSAGTATTSNLTSNKYGREPTTVSADAKSTWQTSNRWKWTKARKPSPYGRDYFCDLLLFNVGEIFRRRAYLDTCTWAKRTYPSRNTEEEVRVWVYRKELDKAAEVLRKTDRVSEIGRATKEPH